MRSADYYKEASKAAAENRAANTQYCLAVDDSLQAIGLPLSKFRASCRVGALAPNERRGSIVDSSPALPGAPPSTCRYRSVVENTDSKERRYELPRETNKDGRLVRPAVHLHLDEGSIGKSFSMWLAAASGVRATQRNDRSHRVHNDCKVALAKSCLYWVCLETLPCFNSPSGP